MRLADEDGFEIMRQLGSPLEAPPIIIITGHRRDEVDRVVGLELGADDYITKPFSLSEEVFDRSIDVRILRLRRKLEVSPSEPKLIVTERGAGYVFAAPVEVQ